MPYAPSPIYARFVYRGPTSKGCSLTISMLLFPTTHSIAILSLLNVMTTFVPSRFRPKSRCRLSCTRSSATAQKQGVSNVFFVAKLLSIAVMTYSYDYHLRSLCPMIWLRLIHYAHSEWTSALCYRSVRSRRTCAWRATPLSFDWRSLAGEAPRIFA